jgi:glycosyltransferase involved in cell wall biosynthesis
VTYISIIIPTHNRADLVEQAVRSAMVLDYPQDCYEIIVVDNASTDATPQTLARLQNENNKHTLRAVREDQLGVHNARHAGARAARGEVLVFTDDDATFDPRWLRAYGTAFAEHPEMGAAGGPIRPVWETPPPPWLLDYIGNAKIFPMLSLMELYREFRLDPAGYFWSVNMAIRRDLLFEVGGFNPEACGNIWLGDGETGLNRKLWNQRVLIGYVPEAVVYHHIPTQRMTVEYLCRRMANEAACDVYAGFHHGVPHWLRLCQYAASIAIKNSRFWIAAPLLRGRTDARALRVQLRAVRTQAQVRYLVRLMCDKNLQKLVLKKDWLEKSSALASFPS